MLYTLLLFLPCFVTLFWIATICLLARKTSTFWPILALFIIGGIFVGASSCYINPQATPTAILVCSILRVTTAPSLLPVCWLYMQRLRGQGSFRIGQLSWIILPAILGAATVVLAFLAGPDAIRETMPIFFSGAGAPTDKIINTYFFITGPITFLAIGIEAIVYIVRYIRMMKQDNLRFSHLYKFQKGLSLRVPEIQSYYIVILCSVFLLTIYIPRLWLLRYPWISIVLSVLLVVSFFQFGYISLFGAKGSISRSDLLMGFRFNYDEETKAEFLGNILEQLAGEANESTRRRLFNQLGANLPYEDLHPAETPAELPKSPASQIFSAVAKSWDDDSLLSRFEHLIFGKQLYLEPGLTLVDVAEKLHTNKTYVSRLVNNTYEMPFPDLVNTLRVDYAEQYIVAHRDARQNEIAMACGFSSASSFNNIFKKVTGMTPKIWLATYETSSQR